MSDVAGGKNKNNGLCHSVRIHAGEKPDPKRCELRRSWGSSL